MSLSQDASRRRFVLAKARALAGWPVVVSMGAGLGLGVFAYWVTSSEREIEDALLRAVVREVENHYVEEVPRSRLVDDAIGGMLARLDDHSMLLDERALATLQEEAAGGFGGVGVQLGVVEGRLTVIEPLPDTPAERAGILAGDQLLQVDHQPVRRLRDASRALRGRPDTPVHVRVRRAAPAATATPREQAMREVGEAPSPREAGLSPAREDAPTELTTGDRPAAAASPVKSAPTTADNARRLDFDITRALIPLPTVHQRLLAPGYGYLRIAQFQEQTLADLGDAVIALVADGPLDGLVVDLRDNPGGLLAAAISVADAFLESGVIVSVAGRAAEEAREFAAIADVLVEDVPIAVLVNQASASGAEIVASALQHHGRAVVLGTKTYGKASVQTITHFPGVSRKARRALKLTTARYFTPAGLSLDNVGVVPDIAVPPRQDERAKDYEQRLLDETLAHFGKAAIAG